MQRVPILRKKLSRLEEQKGKLIIGIIGTHKGAGVTHLSILLSNYFGEWEGRKTALLECGHQKEMQYLQYSFYGRNKEEEEKETFQVHRVTFYKNVKEQAVAEIVGEDYDCVILDLGTDFVKSKSEFLRCDKKIIVSSFSTWKKSELERFINNTSQYKNSNQWMYAIPFGQAKDIKQEGKEFHREMYRVPYEPDPFALSTDTIRLLQKLI
jgi:hypothetical protein